MENTSVVGLSVPRPDAYDKVTGGRGFTSNVNLPGMLYGKMLRSLHPHARVRGMDTSKAKRMPGVKAVLTPVDVPAKGYSPIYIKAWDSFTVIPHVRILDDVVRFAGQPVAVVAAISPEIAEAALKLIEVDYEELPVVFDPEQAMLEGAPQLHAEIKNNICDQPLVEEGDLEAGFAAADHIFEHTYRTHRVHTCYMESWVCVVDAEPGGKLTVYGSTQHIFGLREKLAHLLDIPESKVVVIKPPYVGGGFGAKNEISYAEPLAALLSMQTGRPVRIENSREEDFITGARSAMKIQLKTGVTKEGLFTARHIKVLVDCGAYATYGPVAMMICGWNGGYSAYRCPNRRFEGQAVLTNNVRAGAYRGIGGVQSCFADESHIDEICAALGFDPVEFRLKNAHKEGDDNPLTALAPGRCKLDSYRYEDCLRLGAARSGFGNRKPLASETGTKRRGMGLATQPTWVSGCVGQPDIFEQSGAVMKLNPDGVVSLSVPTVDIGAGQTTVLCQIAAEAIGLPFNQISMNDHVNTNNVPFEPPTHASRVTYSAGNAVKIASLQIRERILDVAAEMLEANSNDLELAKGEIFVKGSPQTSISVAGVARYTESPFLQITPQGPTLDSLEHKGTIMGVSSTAPDSNPVPPCAIFVEVEVDTETGEVRVLRAVYAHDLGKTVNPSAAEGQVEGGVVQGIGYALMENMQFDEKSGACLTDSFLDYKIPTAVEIPATIESIFIESNEPTGPFGAKGLGESPTIVPAPAIANAIYNAIGVRIRELPITPEKILKGLGKM